MLQNKIISVVSVLMLPILISNPVWANGGNRVYWIAADEVLWDYVPSFPVNPMTGNEFTAEERVFVEQGIGRRYLKSVYREYSARFMLIS